MRPSIIHPIDYKIQNAEFNTVAMLECRNFNSPEDCAPIKYLQSSEYEDRLFWLDEQDRASVIPNIQPYESEEFDWHEHGIVERIVTNWVLYNENSILVIVGALGSGKTALAKWVSSKLRPNRKHCKKCDTQGLPIPMDFNDKHIFGRGDIDAIRNAYFKHLYMKLKVCVRRWLINLIDNNNQFLIDSFVGSIFRDIESSMKYYDFDHFVQTEVVGNAKWEEMDTRERANTLIEYLDSIPEPDQQLSGIETICRYVYDRTMLKSRGCALVVFDNIDRYTSDIQADILLEALRFTQRSRIKCIITARLTTFTHHFSNGSYVYDLLPHKGPDVDAILLKRIISYFTSEFSTSNVSIPIDRYRNKFTRRAKYVAGQLKNKKSRVRNYFLALSGFSIRRGLELSDRFWLNNVVLFDDDAPAQDAICLALLADKNGKIDENDQLVSNVFVDMNGRICLDQLRLLNIVHSRLNAKDVCYISNVIDDLSKYKRSCLENLPDAFNKLTKVTNRLLYIDSSGNFKGMRDLTDARNLRVVVTETGIRYLNTLVPGIVYLQAAFAACEWPDTDIPTSVDYSSFFDRARFLRKCLRVILDTDTAETRSYLRNEGDSFRRLPNAPFTGNDFLVSTYMISKCAFAVRNIFWARGRLTHDESNELQDWASLVNEALEQEKELWRKVSPEALRAYDGFKELIESSDRE